MEIETEVTNELEDEVRSAVKEESYSPYKFSKVCSELKGSYVREQMIYNYVSKGYIPSSKVEGKLTISKEDGVVWLVKYLSKNR